MMKKITIITKTEENPHGGGGDDKKERFWVRARAENRNKLEWVCDWRWRHHHRCRRYISTRFRNWRVTTPPSVATRCLRLYR